MNGRLHWDSADRTWRHVLSVVRVRGAIFDRHFVISRRARVFVANENRDRRAQIGEPKVWPSKTLERISQESALLRGVRISDCPGRRRSSSFWIRASFTGMPGAQPSMTTPTPPPCDSSTSADFIKSAELTAHGTIVQNLERSRKDEFQDFSQS